MQAASETESPVTNATLGAYRRVFLLAGPTWTLMLSCLLRTVGSYLV